LRYLTAKSIEVLVWEEGVNGQKGAIERMWKRDITGDV
jgi:hypothetical protein